jgi:hypothetical protein
MSVGQLEIEKRLTAAAVAAAAFAIVLAGSPQEARAEGPVTPTGKGIVGGGLLGAEAVCITLGAIGVERGWPYFVFGGVGAVGGAIGGYFVERTGVPEPSLYMLAGGLALVIPTLVISLNATAYKPPETDRQSEPATGEPAKDAPTPAPAAAPPARTTRRDRGPGPGHKGPTLARGDVPHIPLSVVDVYKGKIALGAPALELRPLYSAREVWQYGVSQGSEVRMPLFQAMF